jgi:hypothetical protein
LKYPVTVGGISGNTIFQGFSLSAAGDLAIAALCSDLALVDIPNTNIAIYFQVSAQTYSWAKQITTGETLVEMKFRTSDSARVLYLYDSSLLVVLNTADGSLVRAQRSTFV